MRSFKVLPGFLVIVFAFNGFQSNAQKEYTITIPTDRNTLSDKKVNEDVNSRKVLSLVQEIFKYAKLHSDIDCVKKLNPIIEGHLEAEMKKISNATAYILIVDYNACEFISLSADTGKGTISSKSWTLYYITLYQHIPVEPVIKNNNDKESTTNASTPILATYKNAESKWIAMGPYMTSDPYETEQQAIASLFYAESDVSFLCQRGKFRIYNLRVKVGHDAQDVRNLLNQFGINDIPKK